MIDTALEDVRRGLADAEAFIEICRFDYKRLRHNSSPPLMDRHDDFGTTASRSTPRRKSAVSASLRRPRAQSRAIDRDVIGSGVSSEAPVPHDVPAPAESVAAAGERAEPIVASEERAKPVAAAEEPVEPIAAAEELVEPVVASEEPAEPTVQELPEIEDPPAPDDQNWPEMPDFLVRKV